MKTCRSAWAASSLPWALAQDMERGDYTFGVNLMRSLVINASQCLMLMCWIDIVALVSAATCRADNQSIHKMLPMLTRTETWLN